MSYGADFANADPANAPLDAPILLGADPVIAAAGLLLLLAALMIGWFLGARGRSNDGDATAAIWIAIDKAAKDAMKADDNALKGRAIHLADVIQSRLGKTLALTAGEDGLNRPVDDLRTALEGRKPEAHDDHDHHDDHGHGHGDQAPAEGHGGHGDNPGPMASASTGSVTIVNVIPGAPAPAHSPKPVHSSHGPREMTARQQTASLRLAVAAFNEHWRHESKRIRAMRAALAELSGDGRNDGPRLSHD